MLQKAPMGATYIEERLFFIDRFFYREELKSKIHCVVFGRRLHTSGLRVRLPTKDFWVLELL